MLGGASVNRIIPPTTDAQLKDALLQYVGITIPDTQVCAHHSTPFRAFADAYFARHPVTVWKACVPESAIIYTECGAVLLSDIKVGDKVWGVKNGKIELGTISRKWYSGLSNIVTIKTRAGELRCSPNHKVLVRRKFHAPRSGQGGYRVVEWQNIFVRADEIKTGGRFEADLLVHPYGHDKRNKTVINGLKITEGFVELCGLILGDGGICKNKFYIAHGEDATYINHYKEIIHELFGKDMRYNNGNRCSFIHSTKAAQLLESLEIKGYAHTKRVPQWVWKLPRNLKIAYLRGYLDSDGTARDCGVEWSSINKMLLEDIKQLCMGIGLRTGRVRQSYIAGEYEIMGRVVHRKDMYTLGCYDGDVIGSNDTRYSWKPRIPQIGEHDESNDIEDVVYHRVLSVDFEPEEAVWDLTVSGTDTFIIDGYITHNSRGFGGKSLTLAALSYLEAITYGASVSLLGGSGEQSRRVHDYMTGEATNIPDTFWKSPEAPGDMLLSDPTKLTTRLLNGGRIQVLTASSKSVRGPHPQKLRCVAGDTLIATPDGNVPIRSIHAGRAVYCLDANDNMTVGIVSGVWCSGDKQTLTLHFTGGAVLSVTPEHPVLTTTAGWITAHKLRVDMQCVGVHGMEADYTIREIEQGGVLDVWDIAVPVARNFIANGIVVHNCDEIDEMDINILDAAMGQPMGTATIAKQTVFSSTHQYASGTMTEILRRAGDRGWPVYSWCFKETSAEGGWLPAAEIESKRQEVTRYMWDVEYNLLEPAPESRAIMSEKVTEMFQKSLGEYPGTVGEVSVFEEHTPNGSYVIGADWARKGDWTVIVVLRIDLDPMRIVAFCRTGREEWPVMVEKFDELAIRYSAVAAHDATGIGDVVSGYMAGDAEDVIMVGRARSDMLSNYIAAIERVEIVSPHITFMESEHRLASVDDVYGRGHLPDSIAAGAIAYSMVSQYTDYASYDTGLGHVDNYKNKWA